MGQSVCKCCNCTSSQDAKRRSTKIYPQRPLSVDCVWTQGSSLPSSIHRRPYLSSDSDFHSMETSMGEEDTYLKKDRDDVGSSEIITEIFLGSQFGGDSTDELPLFLKKLKDVTVRIGTNSRLLVELECRSDFKVTWYRNDNQILASDEYKIVNEGNIYALEFTCVSIQDNGHWTCSAESRKGRVTSSCYLQVIVPKSYKKPVFYEELEAVLTDEGTVSLQCKVVGVPTPVLRWFKDGSEIKAGDIFALVANSRDPISLGTYTCEASNCMGKVYSSSGVKVNSKANLSQNVQEVYNVPPTGQPPIFIQELKNEKIKIGESFILSSKIAVPPWPKSIRWQNPQDEYVDTSNPRYKDLADGIGGYMLEIISSEECDKGTWKCVAVSGDNSKAISSCDIQLTVPKNYRKPYFVEKLRAVLTEDGLVSFECKVVGYPTPHLRWFKDGSELRAGDIYQLTGVSSLGSYLCIAKNCMGEARSEAELTIDDIKQQLSHEETMMLTAIRQPPKFIKKLISSEVPINSPFKFTVQVQMPPTPKLSWYRDDHKLEIDGKKYTQINETQGVFHLNVLKLEFEDQAEWKCVASNEFGRAECSSFLKLIIPKHFKKPKFLENLRAVLTENGIVNLECKVIGVPQPTLKWFKDGVELNPGDIHKIMSGQDGTCCLGLYTCEAHNCMGSVTSSASIHGIEDATPVKPKLRKLSLSTINEEDTFRTADDENSLPIDQPHELSYSFDGKEISVSYYDTPDLTQEEAIQIIEMYADQLSEHISEHNVLELPPLRIVKETSTASNILMEGVVIDIVPEYFTVEEDLRTEVGIEDISVIEDSVFSSQSSGRLRLNSDSRRSVGDKNYEVRSISESIQSPDLYYSLSESKKDDLSLPVSPVSRMSVEPETETFMSAKSVGTLDRRSNIKKTYFQDSPDRPQSTTGQSHTSEETGDIMPDDDSILRHNFQFLTVLLSNNLTDIQQRLCYIEREMFLSSLKQQSDVNESNFKDIGGLIQSIQGLRTFFLSFKQKKNGDFPYTFMDLNHIAEALQVNIDAIHTSIINNPNLVVQKNNVKIVYQVGETLVNVLDLISDIIKLDTFELCKTNVTQTEKQKLINMVLDTRDELNELVIVTHDLFIDTQDVTVDVTDTRKTVDTVDEIMFKLDTDETSKEGLIQEQITKTLGSETIVDETVPTEEKIIEKAETKEEEKNIETPVPKEKVDSTLPKGEEKQIIEEQSEKPEEKKAELTSEKVLPEAKEIQEEKKVVEKQVTPDKPLSDTKVIPEENKLTPEKPEVTLPEKKDVEEAKKPEKQVIEIDISLDKKEVIKELITYQEEKIQDTLFDIDLVKPLFETISELKSPEINVTELFENQTVKNVLVNILNVEKDIIQNQLKEIRLLELDETDVKKISEFEDDKTSLKNQLSKITELEVTLGKDKLPEKDVTAKDKIKKIMSLEWLEQKQNDLKSYLQTFNTKLASFSKPKKAVKQQVVEVEFQPKEQYPRISYISELVNQAKYQDELQILTDLIELYDLQNHYSTITNDQLWDLAQELQQNVEDQTYETKLTSIENKLERELNLNQLKQFSLDTTEKIATEDTISDIQDQILDIKVKKFALYLVSDLQTHKVHPQSTDEIFNVLMSELPQTLEHKKHKINLELEYNADTFLTKLKKDFQEIEELKNAFQSKDKKLLFNELKSLSGKYNLNDLDTEEKKLSRNLDKIITQKKKDPQNKTLIEEEKSIQQEIYNVKFMRILVRDLVMNKNLTLDPLQVLEDKHEQIVNSINVVKQTLNQKVLTLNDLKSYTKNNLAENSLKEIIQNVATKQDDPSFEEQLHSDEINYDIQANEIKSQILFLEESLKESTETEDKELGEKHLAHLQEEYKHLIEKLMHTQVAQLTLEKLKMEQMEVINLVPIIDLIEEKRASLTTQLSELNLLEGATGTVLSSQLDLTNDEKIVILKKLQIHFANISKTEKSDFLKEISTNYNKEEYVTNLNTEIEKLTSQMHEINVQKVSVKNADEIQTLEANEQSVENKLLHAKIKQLAIAKLCELKEIHDDITDDLKNIETIIPNILQEQEILLKSEIDYTKPKILQEFQISQQEEFSEFDTLTEQQSNLIKLKEHFISVIKNEISEIVEELASNYKNKGEQYVEALNSEEIQLKDTINDLKLQKYNIELQTDSTLEKVGKEDNENTSEKVKVIDTEIAANETKLLTSQIKKLAVAKVTNINTQTEKLEDLFEDALLSLPNILNEEEKLLQAAVKTKAEVLESIQTTQTEEIKDVSAVKQIVERPDLQVIESVEAQQKLENIHKLKQYFANVVANDMSEIVEELISNSKDVNYATELKVDEAQIKGKINYLAKWQTYNLEKLSTIPADEAEDITQKESILDKVNTLQQEINLNEAKLLKTQIKIMALAKLDEITDKSKPLEDLFQDALLSIPNVLQEEEQLIYTATKVETLDVKFIPESKELTAEKKAIKLREQIKTELNSNNEDILKLRQHTTNFNEVEINKIVEEVALNARDKDDYTNRLKTEEKRLKERIKDLKWQRYNLERLSSMSTDKSENQNDILETAKILEHEITYNEGKLLNTQIKKMMVANVAEVIDQTENLTDLFQDILLNLATALQNEELIGKPTSETPSIVDDSVTTTLTKEQDQTKSLEEIKSRDGEKRQVIDEIVASSEEIKEILSPENAEKISKESEENTATGLVLTEDKGPKPAEKIVTEENKVTELVLIQEEISDKAQISKHTSSVKPIETKDTVVSQSEKVEKDDTQTKEIISPKEIVEDIPQVLEKVKTGDEQPKEAAIEKSEQLEKKTVEDRKSKEEKEDKEQIIPTIESAKEKLPMLEKVEPIEKETEIISKQETVEEKSKASAKKTSGDEKLKQTPEETKEIELEQKLQSIKKLKEHYATVTKYEIEEVVEELKSEAKDPSYAEQLDAEEERLKCRIDDLKWQQNYLVRLSKIPTDEFDDASEKGDIVRKVRKLDREISSNEEKLLGTQIKKLAIAQIKSSNESWEKLDDLFEDALLNIPNILREEERNLQNPPKPKEDVLVVEPKTLEELQPKLSTDEKLEINVNEKSEAKSQTVEKSNLEVKVSEKGIDAEMLNKLMQHHATIAKTKMSELVNELTSNAQNQNYAKQLDNDETQLKAKINDLKWQRYNLEKLSDITTEKTYDLVKDESVLEKAQILEDEIFLNEVNLLNIQIKKLALAKVSEITYQPEIVEDLFEDALLSFPDILLEQEKFIKDMSEISVKSPEIQTLSEIQQISENTKELDNVTKLKEHIAGATKDEIAEIVKELTTESKDDTYANKLETEDTKLKAKLNDLRWQRYNLEHSIKISSEQKDDKTQTDKDSLEKLKILEQEISENETKLLENQIKIMALGQVAEIKDESENVEELFADALLKLPNVLLEKENSLSQNISTVVEAPIVLQEIKTEIQEELIPEEKKEEVKGKTENEEKSISVEEEKLQVDPIDEKTEKTTEIKKDNEVENKTVSAKTEDIDQEKLIEEPKTVDSKEKENGDDNKQLQSKQDTEKKVIEEKENQNKASDDLKDKISKQKEKGQTEKEETIKVEKDKIEDKVPDKKQKRPIEEKKEQKTKSPASDNEKEKSAKEITEEEGFDKTVKDINETADVKLELKVESEVTEEKQESIEDLKKEKIEEKTDHEEVQKLAAKEVKEQTNAEKKEQAIESKYADTEKEKLSKETKEKQDKTVDKKEKLTKEKKEEKIADKAVKVKDVDTNIEALKGEISEVDDKEILIKLQQYYENMTENEKHEVAKELTINATDEEYCKQLVADEEKLKAKINDLKWQRYNLEKWSNVALDQVDNIPDNDTMLEKLHILAEEISLNETTLQNIQIKKLALAQVAEIVDKSENLEDLFEDCLLNMPTILEEDKIRLISQPKIISTIISQIQKVKEEQIKVTPLEATKDEAASLSPEKEIEQKLDSILKLKEYLTSVTQDEVAEIVEELKSNSSNEDYAEQLEIEETQYKANISELKLQKHNLEESSSIIFEKTENIELEDLLLEKANVLEQEITQNEAKLLNTQVKKLALAKVNEIAEVCENIEGLIEDVVLSIPAILQEEQHMLQTIKIETPLVKTEIPASKLEPKLEEIVSKPLEALIKSEKQMTTEDIEQLNLHYGSVTSAKIAEFIKEWQSDNDEIAYANRLIVEEKQLTAAINEIKAHKVLLESISTSQNGNSEDLENKRNLEQIAILEQEELLLNNRLKDNQIKKIAIASVYVESNEEEEKVDLLKKIFLNMLNVLKEKSEKLKCKNVDEEENVKLGEKLLVGSEEENKEVFEIKEQVLKKQKETTQTEKVVEEKSITKEEKLQEAKTSSDSKIELEEPKDKKLDILKQEASVLEEKLETTNEKQKDLTKSEPMNEIKSESKSKTNETKVEEKDLREIDKQKQEDILENNKEKLEVKVSKSIEEKKPEDLAKIEEKENEKALLSTNSEKKAEIKTKSSLETNEKKIDEESKKEVSAKSAVETKVEPSAKSKEENEDEAKVEPSPKTIDEKKEEPKEKEKKSKSKASPERTEESIKEKKEDTKLEEAPKPIDEKKEETKVEPSSKVIDEKKEEPEEKQEKSKTKTSPERTEEIKKDDAKIEQPSKPVDEKQYEAKVEPSPKPIDENNSELKVEPSPKPIGEKKDGIKVDPSSQAIDEKKEEAKEKSKSKTSPERTKESIKENKEDAKLEEASKPIDEKKEETKVEPSSKAIDEKKEEPKEKKEKSKSKTSPGSTEEIKKEKKEETKDEQLSKHLEKTKDEVKVESSPKPVGEKKDEIKVEPSPKAIDENKEESKEKAKFKTSPEGTEEIKKEDTKQPTKPDSEKKEEVKVEPSPKPVKEKRDEVNLESSPKPVDEKKDEIKVEPSPKAIDEKKEEPKEKKEKSKSKTSPERKEESKEEKKKGAKVEQPSKPVEEKKDEVKVEPSPKPVEEKRDEVKVEQCPKPVEEKIDEVNLESSPKPVDEKKDEIKVEPSPKTIDEKKEEPKEKKEKSKSKTSPERKEERNDEKKKGAKVEQPSKPVEEKKDEVKVEPSSKPIEEKKDDTKVEPSPKAIDEKKEEPKEMSKSKTSPERIEEIKKEEKDTPKVEQSSKCIEEKRDEVKVEQSPKPVEEKRDEVNVESSPKPVDEKKDEIKVEPSPKTIDEKKEEPKEKKEKSKSKTSPERKEESKEEKKKGAKVEQPLKPVEEKKDEVKVEPSPKPIEEKKDGVKVEPSSKSIEEKKDDTKVEQPSKPVEEKKDEVKVEPSPKPIEEKKDGIKVEPSSKPIEEKKDGTKVEPSPKAIVEKKEEPKEMSKSKTSPEHTEENKIDDAKLEKPSKPVDEKKDAAKVEQSSKPIEEKKDEVKVEPSPKPEDDKKGEVKVEPSSKPKEEKKVELSPKAIGEKKEELKDKREKSKSKASPERMEETKKEKKKEAKTEQTSEPFDEKKEETKVEPSPKAVDETKEEPKEKSKSITSPERTEQIKKEKKEIKQDANVEQPSKPVEEKKDEINLESSPKAIDEKKEEPKKKKEKSSSERTEEIKKEKREEKKDEQISKIDKTKDDVKVEPSPKPIQEEKDEVKVEPSSKPIEEKKDETKVEPSPKAIDEKKEEPKDKFKSKTSPEHTEENKKDDAKLEKPSKPVDEKKDAAKVEPSPKPIEEKKDEMKVAPESNEKKKDETKVESSSISIGEKKEEPKEKSKSKISPERTEEIKKEKKEDAKVEKPSKPVDEKKDAVKVEPISKAIDEKKDAVKIEPISKAIDEKKDESKEKKEKSKSKLSPERTEEKKKEDAKVELNSKPVIDKKEEAKVEPSLKPTEEKKEKSKGKASAKSKEDSKVETTPKPTEEKKEEMKTKTSTESKVDKKEEMETKSVALSKESELQSNKDTKSKTVQDDNLNDSKHSKTLDGDKKVDKEKTIEKKKERKSSISSKLDEDKSRSEKVKRKESISSLEKQDKGSKKETVIDTTNQRIEDTARKESSTYKSSIAKKEQQLESNTQEKDKVQSFTSRSTYRQISNAESLDRKPEITLSRARKTTDTYRKDTEISSKQFGAIPKRVEPTKDVSRLKVEVPTSNWESRNLTSSNRQASPSRNYHKYDNIIKDTEISRSFKNADEIKKGYKTIISDYQSGSEVLKQEKQLLSSLSDYSKSVSLTSNSVSPKTYSVEPLLFARNKPRSKYNNNLYSHAGSDNFHQALRDTRKTHDRIRNLISLSESVTNSLISTNTISYNDYEKRSRRHRHAIRANLQISKYKPSIDLNYYDGYNRISQIDRTMDFEPYYDHYFKLPMMYAVYKSNIERSYLYPRRYEVTLYCGYLRRHETIVRGYNRYQHGGYSYPKIIKHDADESFNLNAVKFSCYDNCHSYETCRHQPDARSLVNTTTGKLVLGQKGYMEVCPLRSQHRSVKWRSPDSDKYLKGETGTDTITTRVRSSLVFVSVKPKDKSNIDRDIPKIKTLRSACTSTSKHSNYSPRLQKSTTMFITQPDSLISVAPGQDITVSFELNPDSNAKVNWTKRSMDVTRNPRFRTEILGNVTRYILRNSNYDDMGTYCLSAENNYSTSKAFVTVTVDNNCIYKNTTYYKLLKKHNLPSIGSIRSMPTYSKLQDMQITTYRPTNVITSYSMVPPIFYTLPHNTVAEIGESARFQVTVGGYPSPTVTWTKDGRVISHTSKNRVIEKFNTKVLEVTLIAAEDAGTYTITIQNEAGRASASARLDIITMKNKPSYNLRM